MAFGSAGRRGGPLAVVSALGALGGGGWGRSAGGECCRTTGRKAELGCGVRAGGPLAWEGQRNGGRAFRGRAAGLRGGAWGGRAASGPAWPAAQVWGVTADDGFRHHQRARSVPVLALAGGEQRVDDQAKELAGGGGEEERLRPAARLVQQVAGKGDAQHARQRARSVAQAWGSGREEGWRRGWVGVLGWRRRAGEGGRRGLCGAMAAAERAPVLQSAAAPQPRQAWADLRSSKWFTHPAGPPRTWETGPGGCSTAPRAPTRPAQRPGS